MKIDLDTPRNSYVDLDRTVRVTYVAAKNRQKAKNWAGQDVIRIQAYQRAKGGRLHKGAEFPVGSAEEIVKLVGAICQLREQAGR